MAKSASAFARAFLAILVLELEDMWSDWFARSSSPAFMAIVGHFVWVSRLTSGVPPGACKGGWRAGVWGFGDGGASLGYKGVGRTR